MTNSPVSPHCLVFDSGIGGLTVVDELSRLGFRGRVSYAADTGFFPYGDKSDDDLIRRIPRLSGALVRELKPDIFVIACNTASTLALELVRAVLDIPVVGTVPAIKPAAKLTKSGTIGILATPGTLKRAYTGALVREFARHCNVMSQGSVALVELAERYAAGEEVPDDAILRELNLLFRQPGGSEIDTVVLACTHFPLLQERFRTLVGDDITFVDSGNAIARRVLSLLGQADPVPPVSERLERGDLWTTGATPSSERLEKVAARYGFDHAGQINLDDRGL